MERETMEFDIVVVGAGPAGLSAACRLGQLSQANGLDLNICVIEKGAQVGAHILSGAVFEPKALDELFPDWQDAPPPMTPVSEESLIYLATNLNHFRVPQHLAPNTLFSKHHNYVISLGQLCIWLADQAEQLGVEIFPGFAARNIHYDNEGNVNGIVTSDLGIDKEGNQKSSFEPGIILKAKYTVFAEGARGHLGCELIRKFKLGKGKQPQHYALGIKELWQLPENDPRHKPGTVIHGLGWPLSETNTNGGSFLYHLDNHQIAVGIIVDLNYSNPYLDPFEEFQRLKHHPAISKYLEGGERLCFGARALAKGGLFSLPKQQFPGGLLIGCDAGTLDNAKIKGCHTAMKSGLLAAEAIAVELAKENPALEVDYQTHFEQSWLYDELNRARNFNGAIHKHGPILGGALATIEQNIWPCITRKPVPWNIKDPQADYVSLKDKYTCTKINYPKPDKKLSFDRPSSVYLSGTKHEENQPNHLHISSYRLAISNHLPMFDEPSQRYCPAGVYEIVEKDGNKHLHINPTNCLHCKTCDIKDPSNNITWVPPEGGGGPDYRNM